MHTSGRNTDENKACTNNEENAFGISILKEDIRDILTQISHYLGEEYENLLDAIRNALSRYTD